MSEPLVTYWAYGAMLCDDMRYQADHPAVYLAADVDALLRQREEDFTMAEDERIEAVRRYEVAEQQLAAMTAERDEAKVIVRKIAEGIDPMVALVNGMGSVMKLEQQLSAAHARCAQLETLATKLLAECLEHNQEYHYTTKPELIQEVRQALTPTERPPAAVKP